METLSRRDREKQTRENEMIQAAEAIFRQKGYENSSMDDIAREAQFTKRTLYQYFTSKDELFFAVLRKGMGKLQSAIEASIQPQANGFEKIQQVYQASYRFYLEYPEIFKLLNSIGPARKSEADTNENREGYLVANDAMFRGLAAIISEGQADGSISPELEPHKTAMSLLFIMTGLFNQLAVSGNSFSIHFGMDVKDFSAFTMGLILRTIQNQDQLKTGKSS
jgi:AcrR family transcriptional regulator